MFFLPPFDKIKKRIDDMEHLCSDAALNKIINGEKFEGLSADEKEEPFQLITKHAHYFIDLFIGARDGKPTDDQLKKFKQFFNHFHYEDEAVRNSHKMAFLKRFHALTEDEASIVGNVVDVIIKTTAFIAEKLSLTLDSEKELLPSGSDSDMPSNSPRIASF